MNLNLFSGFGRIFTWFLTLSLLAGNALAQSERTFPISALDISRVEQDWGGPRANQSVEQHTLSIGGQTFTNGLGTHAASEFALKLDGRAESFPALVGVDDEVGKGRGSIVSN